MSLSTLRSTVQTVDWKGVKFKDIAGFLQEPTALTEWRTFVESVQMFDDNRSYLGRAPPSTVCVAAVDGRGFIFGSVAAAQLESPLILVRKKGALPQASFFREYKSEYAESALELSMHVLYATRKDVVLVDDILATGGTAKAAVMLLRDAGLQCTRALFLCAIEGLAEKAKLELAEMGVTCHFMLGYL